jgi:hypothetical protein
MQSAPAEVLKKRFLSSDAHCKIDNQWSKIATRVSLTQLSRLRPISSRKPFPSKIGHPLFNEFEKRRSNQLRHHAVVRRLRFLADLANKCGRRAFTYRISFLKVKLLPHDLSIPS